jgi:type IV pilus assembly protein PilC
MASATKQPTIVAKGDSDQIVTFLYKARNTDGKIVTGQARAMTKTDVSRELMARGMAPIDIKGGAGASLFADGNGLRKSAKKRDLVIASRMIAAMLDSGLSYIEALDIVRKDCEDPLLASALNEVRIAIQNGSSMSDAMNAQGDVFPPIMRNLITSGEVGGKVKEAMNRVADQLDKEDKLRAKVKKATMQPLILTFIASIIFSFMMLVLVPKFTQTFVDLGGPGTKLPFLTQQVVNVSKILKIALPVFLVTFVPGLIYYNRIKNRPGVREVMDPFKLKLPVFGNLFHKIALQRFTQNLSGLLEAGVDRLQALEITATTVGNIQMENATLKARDAQRSGLPLVEPLRAEELFPNMLIQMVEAGEKSGRTAFMLKKASEIYERDVDMITDSLAELISPIFMVVLGIMVGVVVIAIYLPYMHLADVIESGQ